MSKVVVFFFPFFIVDVLILALLKGLKPTVLTDPSFLTSGKPITLKVLPLILVVLAMSFVSLDSFYATNFELDSRMCG